MIIITKSFSPNDLNYHSDLLDVSFKFNGCMCNSAWGNDAKKAKTERGRGGELYAGSSN